VPIAEETGLIVPLGAWVLRAACVQLAEWRRLPQGAGLTMGVNVSRRQLTDPGFEDLLADALGTAALEPGALRLEISEIELSRYPDGLRSRLVHLLEAREIAMVEVPEEEFLSLGPNVLALGPRRAITVDANPVTRSRMQAAGVEVLTYPGNQICLNGDGGPTCLTRPLARA